MLKHLKVQNFALIDYLEIDWQSGLSVITGETGAGKSILLGALRLILGGRADHSSLKDNERKCIVEGNFYIEGYGLEKLFEKHDLDYWEEMIIRREISPSGKSRGFINDTPVRLELMKSLGEHLVDIHSQNQSLQINDADFQLSVIDAVAQNKLLLKDYQDIYLEFKECAKQIQDLENRISESNKNQDYWQYLFDELQALNYKTGEEEELSKEQEMLSNSELIIQNYQQINQLLLDGEDNVLDQLKQVRQLLNETSAYVNGIDELSNRFSSSLIEIEDIANEVNQLAEEFDFEPNRLQMIDERLAQVHHLKRKHDLDDASGLISLTEDLSQKLSQHTSYDNELNQLKDRLAKLHTVLGEKANSLSQSRIKVLNLLSQEIQDCLTNLGIPEAVLQVKHQEKIDFSFSGKDSFIFEFSANKGVKPQLLSKTASGGEISRLVLAIKTLLADRQNLPTILFDEIDTGVSGEVANQMGVLLSKMGHRRQVISITHLPQIAAKGEQHLYVYKEHVGSATVSNIKTLTEHDRVEELAKMLSGDRLSEAALNNAKDLLAY